MYKFITLLLITSLQCAVTVKVSCNGSATLTEILEHYSNNFKTNSQIQLESKECYLTADLIIQNISNFSLIGETPCKIICVSHVSILIFNVTDFKLEHINFENCSKNYSHDPNTTVDYDHVSVREPSNNASIILYNCTSVVINNISVLVNAGTTGILVVNVRGNSTLTNISITVNYTIYPTVNKHSEQINGILFYYDDKYNNKSTNMELDNFKFVIDGSCTHPLQYAITLLLFQKQANVSFIIKNINFNNLQNVQLLYYYGETCGIFVQNNVTFENCVISNNIGCFFHMFEIILYNKGCFRTALLEQYCNQQYNNITFINSKFINNHNITSMIYVTPASSRTITSRIYVMNSSFCNNDNTHYLTLESNITSVWQLSNKVNFESVTISSNSHNEGKDLISATNCYMNFTGITFITNNILYNNIIKLHFSGASFKNNITITMNTARQVFYGSHILIMENTTLNVSFNTVYMVVKQTLTFGVGTKVVCGVQFYMYTNNSKEGNLDNSNVTKLPFKVIAVNNTHMTSKNLPGQNLLYHNCQWLAGTAFHTRNSTEVYKQIFNVSNLIIGDCDKRPVPLSVCKCGSSSDDDDCYSPHLGSIFPGETLTVQLSIQEQWISVLDQPKAIIAENSDPDNCTIVHASELSQTYFNDANHCNSYNYTLWPQNDTITQCQLFIGLNNMPEMFYVQIKPCPKGFTFQSQRKACYCDPILTTKLSITSCNVKDETILRPANSWIFAYTDDNSNSLDSQKYKLSLYCPLNNCIPESSHINLSNPDSQCQFNRTGLLCGDCKPGLSVVLGTPQCKPCSNIYLLLLIPIGFVGVVLVILLFNFNLTVRNPTINTLIFYVNIIKINMWKLFPGCRSVFCIIFSFLNLYFAPQTCFYNGMDDYAKEWLNLLYCFYFISLPILFIVLSRYSARLQRLTAQRALPVLATLILLSYNKIVLIVCNVLFRYSTITYLPSNKTKVVWSISTTTPLFGVKFLILLALCIILFLILLPFNVILLFTRRLSHFALVTKLKPLLDTYFSAYKDKAYYWTGLLLLIRVIIYALSAFDNDISFITISILLTGLLCLHGAVQPFKSKFHNIQESITVANLVVVHTAQLYKKDLLGPKVAQLLLAIGVTYFIIMITIHCCMDRCKSEIYRGIKCLHHIVNFICKANISQQNNEMESLSNSTADVTYNYKEFQEPLVEFDN